MKTLLSIGIFPLIGLAGSAAQIGCGIWMFRILRRQHKITTDMEAARMRVIDYLTTLQRGTVELMSHLRTAREGAHSIMETRKLAGQLQHDQRMWKQ